MNATKTSPVFTFIRTVILIFAMLVCLYPLYYVLMASLSQPELLISHTGMLLKPLGFTFKGYEMVFKNPNIPIGYVNTIIYLVLGLIVNMIMTTAGAYVLSRKNAMFVKPMFIIILVTMFFNGGIIPRYILLKELHILDTRWALIIPSAINTFNLILMKTAFAGIPDELIESGKLDGASELVILVRIVLPLSLPILAVMVLYYGVAHWNQWTDAMMYLQNRKLFPLQLFLREILIENEGGGMVQGMGSMETNMYQQLIKYCAIIVATVPILFIYPFVQKYFMNGLTAGAVKG